MSRILFCEKCREYTLKTACPKCGAETGRAEPPKFSLKDPYGKYRRIYKKRQSK